MTLLLIAAIRKRERERGRERAYGLDSSWQPLAKLSCRSEAEFGPTEFEIPNFYLTGLSKHCAVAKQYHDRARSFSLSPFSLLGMRVALVLSNIVFYLTSHLILQSEREAWPGKGQGFLSLSLCCSIGAKLAINFLPLI